MQTPAQIDFQGMSATPQLDSMIADHIAELEDRYGRITSCRIVVKSPGERHRHGGLYEVNIALALPDGREVNIGRTPPQDERHADLVFALNDAFRRARRQLQDRARQLAGDVKQHETQPVGTITRIDTDKEFGFLTAADGHEVYFHRNSVLDGAFERLKTGTAVSFTEEAGNKGPQATTVRLLGKHAMRV